MTVVLQTAGKDRYTGPLIHDRFQVLETLLRGKFMLADHANGGLPVTSGGETIRFSSREEAEEHAAYLITGKAPPRPAGDQGSTRRQTTASGESSAAMFRRLILRGDLTDDQIFKEVQKAFGLADNRRAYVKWYRNDLVKKGQLKA